MLGNCMYNEFRRRNQILFTLCALKRYGHFIRCQRKINFDASFALLTLLQELPSLEGAVLATFADLFEDVSTKNYC